MYACYATSRIDQEELALSLIVSNGLGFGTALHEIAQVNAAQALSQKYGPAVLEYNIGGHQEADIKIGGQAWEVKSWNNSSETQLRNDETLGNLTRGSNEGMSPISDIPIIGDIKMEVSFSAKPGEINYSYYKTGDDGERKTVPFWQVCWEMEWRPTLAELGITAAVVAAAAECVETGGVDPTIIPQVIQSLAYGDY